MRNSLSSLQTEKEVFEKANRVLAVALIVFLVIAFRIWYLCVPMHSSLTERARSPQKKTVIVKAPRGTIKDRFGIYLARNKLQYNAAVLYSPIRQIPRVRWQKSSDGEKVKVYTRKEYIKKLSLLLGSLLDKSAEEVEDLIHSKASLFPNAPYALQADISEDVFYKLKALEKDWPGLYAEVGSKRYYPKGKVASSIVGYMGAISQREYQNILEEKALLENLLVAYDRGEPLAFPPDYSTISAVWDRLNTLKERAYSFHDNLGKTGIEGEFEEELRGFHGKRFFYSDSRGNFLRELPGKKPAIPGKQLQLSISTSLQEHAEMLLANNEIVREGKSREFDWDKRRFVDLKQPWIKGGAIVALDPASGDILALATYPRFDPRDFIEDQFFRSNKQRYANIHRWLETDSHLSSLWEEREPLEREVVHNFSRGFEKERVYLSWDRYLDFVLPFQEEMKRLLSQEINLKMATELLQEGKKFQQTFPEHLLGELFNELYPEDLAYPLKKYQVKGDLSSYTSSFPTFLNYLSTLKSNYERVLTLDLLRLLTFPDVLTDDILDRIGDLSLTHYKELSKEFFSLENLIKPIARDLFKQQEFQAWRKAHFKSYLKQKRKEEEERGSYAKPWVDYLEKKESELFAEFWEHHRWSFYLLSLKDEALSPPANLASYWQKMKHTLEETITPSLYEACQHLDAVQTLSFLHSFRPYSDLEETLWGIYPNVRKEQGVQKEKHLASAFYPIYGFNFNRSHAFQLSSTLGSIFKLVTSYTIMMQRYLQCESPSVTYAYLNPLTMIDRVERLGEGSWRVGYWLDGKPIPQVYRGGRLPRSAGRNFGKLDLVKALAVSSNPYFSIIAGEILEDPNLLRETASLFSFGSDTQVQLPGEFKGKLPSDLSRNRTGAYTFAIGQHTLLVTPLQTAVMLGTFANGGYVLRPRIAMQMTGQERASDQLDEIFSYRKFPYQRELANIGVHFPLFSDLLHPAEEEQKRALNSETIRRIPMPPEIRETLFEAMHQTLHNNKYGSARKVLITNYPWHHKAYQSYLHVVDDMIGKTSTSQVPDRVGIDLEKPSHMYKSIWFGAISLDKNWQAKSTSLPPSRYGAPEIVVAVYLRYGNSGHEAAPLAASMIEKWRKLRQEQENISVEK